MDGCRMCLLYHNSIIILGEWPECVPVLAHYYGGCIPVIDHSSNTVQELLGCMEREYILYVDSTSILFWTVKHTESEL